MSYGVIGVGSIAARRHVASMFAGLAVKLRDHEDFAELARDHATPGGINEQFRGVHPLRHVPGQQRA